MAERFDTKVDVTGIRETVSVLRALSPEALKKMNRAIRASLDVVEKSASNKGFGKGSYKVKVGGKNPLGRIVTMGKGGLNKTHWSQSDPGAKSALFEMLNASRSPNRKAQVEGLINTLNARYGKPGRFLWSAWDEVSGGDNSPQRRIERAVRQAEEETNAKIGRTVL